MHVRGPLGMAVKSKDSEFLAVQPGPVMISEFSIQGGVFDVAGLFLQPAQVFGRKMQRKMRVALFIERFFHHLAARMDL